jgi:hypothetical protein
MAGQQARQTRGGRRTPAGDATGRTRDKLMEENADALKARGGEITTVTPPPVLQVDGKVVDYTDPGGVREIDPSELEDGLTEMGDDIDGPISEEELDDLPDGTTDVNPGVPHGDQARTLDQPPAQGQPHTREQPPESPGSLRGQKGKAGQPSVVQQQEQPEVLEKPYRRMRVNTTLEDVTVGKDPITQQLNNYTFEEGVTYKVPQHVYNHLDRLGYVYH